MNWPRVETVTNPGGVDEMRPALASLSLNHSLSQINNVAGQFRDKNQELP
jgi:hypothetical protein